MEYIRVLSETQARDHAKQSHELWGEGTSLVDRQTRLCQRLKTATPGTFFMSGLVAADGRLVASLKRYYFPVRVQNQSRPCLGLGAIFTEPEFRAQGLADRLIRTVLAEDEGAGCKTALLFSDIGTKYYTRFGFQEAPESGRFRLESKASTESPPPLREATAADFTVLHRLYAEHCRYATVALPRTPDSWRLFHEINDLGRDLIWTDTNGQPRGYLNAKPRQGYLWLAEAVCALGDERLLWACIHGLAQSLGLAEIRGWSDRHWPKPQVGLVFEPRTGGVPMLRGPGIAETDLDQAHFGSCDHF